MDPQPTLDKDTKSAKIMLGIFGLLTLLFVCGGGAVVGVAASGSETEGMNAAMMMTGPACCAMSGLFGALLALVAFPTKKTAQIVVPVLAGFFGGGCGAAGIYVFFAQIWYML